jgi:predicted PhzF superfamily epimerase YddE/YHI9
MRGNPCLLHLAEAAPESAPANTDIIQCVTWAREPLRAMVRCWAPTGIEIQLCGHGLLCCANYWRDQWGSPGVLEMNGNEVHCANQDDVEWLSFPSLETRDCEVPQWAAQLLGQAPANAAEAGPADGYLILEMPQGCDPASLQAPGEALKAETGRSLIVTRRTSAADSFCSEDIQYRYFAPQHGVPEDTATGSAMRVLAAYWLQRGAGSKLKALQRSADGGWLTSRIDNGRTWIGGRVVEDKRRETA